MNDQIPVVFLGGFLAMNGVPHMLNGLLGRRFPSLVGFAPLANYLSGFCSSAIGIWLLATTGAFDGSWQHPAAAMAGALAVGILFASGAALRLAALLGLRDGKLDGSSSAQ